MAIRSRTSHAPRRFYRACQRWRTAAWSLPKGLAWVLNWTRQPCSAIECAKTWQVSARGCSSAMDGKSRGHHLLKVAASPVPGGDLAPEAVRGLLGVGVHLCLVDVHDIAPLDQSLAVDNHGIHITPTTKIHQGLERVGVEGGAEVVEVDEQDIGFCARCQASQVVAAQEGAGTQGGGVVDIARLADLVVLIGNFGEHRSPA